MILVTGATGNVGSELVAELLANGRRVRTLTRRDRNRVPPEAEGFEGDLNQPATLRVALNGVRRVFLLGGSRDMPGLLEEIQRAGVEHVVLLSSRSVIGGDESNAIVRMWLVSEAAVKSSSVPWTILRPSGFMSNALRWLPQLQSADTVRAAFAEVPIAAIDPFDIARVAAIALTTDEHTYRSYVLTGPEAILPADQVGILGKVLGRNLRFEPMSDAEARLDLGRLFSPDFVDAMFSFYARGDFDDSKVLEAVREITGTPPRSFEQWARVHMSAFH